MTQASTKTMIRDLIQQRYPMPPNVERMAQLANWDLWHGPIGPTDDDGNPWPGFQGACDIVRDWIDSLPTSEVWVDTDCDFVSESEPEGYEDEEMGEWIEPFLELTWHVAGNEFIRAVTGYRELASYL